MRLSGHAYLRSYLLSLILKLFKKSIVLQCLSFQNSSLLISYFTFSFLARARLLGVFTSLGLEGDVAATVIMLLGSGGHSFHDLTY